MRNFNTFQACKPMINKTLLFLVLLSILPVFPLLSQVDFSGVWVQDKAKTDDFYKSFNIVFTIKQTSTVLNLNEEILSETGEKLIEKAFTFSLDGKEYTEKKDGGINKKSARWSADRKILTLSDTRELTPDIMGSHRSFSLSSDGKILTVNTTDANPLTGLKVKQVFNKK
jgi:hypothetical protein